MAFFGAPSRQQPLRTHKIDEIVTNAAASDPEVAQPETSRTRDEPELHMYFEFIMHLMVNYTTLRYLDVRIPRLRGRLSQLFWLAPVIVYTAPSVSVRRGAGVIVYTAPKAELKRIHTT